MLQVSNMSCGYQEKKILKNLSFTVGKGEKLCVLGSNGCGKTTLLRAVAGLLKFEGEISANGIDVKNSNRNIIASKIALMSQLSSLSFSYTVYEAVLMGRYVYAKNGFFSSNSATDREFIMNCLEKNGILELKDKQIAELSGGQLQRVFLARTFAQDPEIILLDEPTNHLDLKYQISLIKSLENWVRQKERCVIGVFHDINLALSFADSILLLENGEIVAHSTAKEFDLKLLNEVYEVDVHSYMNTIMQRWK